MLNPITYAEDVVSDFLRYQLTTYPFADEQLHAQMRKLLDLEHTRNTPLLKGPFVSLSRSFRQGSSIDALTEQGILHKHIKQLAPHSYAYGHQEKAWRSISGGLNTLVATGTGSGKTECFLYPIISHCLKLRDEEAPDGIVAVLVYPMNALAEDQLGRLRGLLAGSGVSFGMYVGKTPEGAAEATGKRLPKNSTRADYEKAVEKAKANKETHAIYPPEERASREEMRTAGKRPRILLTNVKQLELLLTRQRDVELFDNSALRFLVFDEAHTFSGAQGAETACLIRRLRTFCGKKPDEVICVATSATIADPERGPEAGKDFAERFFGVDKNKVTIVGEMYEEDSWAASRSPTPALSGKPSEQLKTVLEAVRSIEEDLPRPENIKKLLEIYQSLTGQKLPAKDWKKNLYDSLASNEVVFQLARSLKRPKSLANLVTELKTLLHRVVPEEEILIWLALGAVSRNESRPLLRPVVHAFVRGMQGAVVSFPLSGLKLWLSRADAQERTKETLRELDVTTCTTCGQHYFVHFADDFLWQDKGGPSGGRADGDSVYWPSLADNLGGKRVVLVDRLVGGVDDEESLIVSDTPFGTAKIFFCRACGALHKDDKKICKSCGRKDSLLALFAVRQAADNPGYLTRCLSCGANGRRLGSQYREPARPVRAITVSDVHVLAQNMLHHAERRRLLIFADNRQDAAFQAGWMQDHARRYRLRALMYEYIKKGSLSVGDLVSELDKRLAGDDDLSQALLPEVWRAEKKEHAGTKHAEERKYFLRIQVLRELTSSLRHRIGLEPWGRICPSYKGLEENAPFVQRWATVAKCSQKQMLEAIAILLDISRRSLLLHDHETNLFTRWWSEGDREIQYGYFSPGQGGPKALKLARDSDDTKGRVLQWLSDRGQTRALQLTKRWKIPDTKSTDFLRELWSFLANDIKLLIPVQLVNQWKKAVPGTAGAHQIDSGKLLIVPQKGLFQCQVCRRTQLREGPYSACIQWRCSGTVKATKEDPDNYDLRVLDEEFALIRAREHSAQVPHDDREIIERIFKGEGESINALVATPTLELGVDIGALDAVLMRNVPPLAANYWQRVGRAGRRHRMAVNLTYAGAKSHDRAYFQDPLKLLEGRIDPPRFNLKNELMIQKHVHATVLSVLFQLGRASALPEAERKKINDTLSLVFPEHVKSYLFTNTGEIRTSAFDVSPLETLLNRFQQKIASQVEAVFSGCWPQADRTVVQPESLKQFIEGMPQCLCEVISRLERRLRWALDQLNRLEETRKKKGVLESAEEALRKRCEELVKKLKGQRSRKKQQAEGYDDTVTYSVLAAEAFLPGYGLDTGSVVGFHQAPRYAAHLKDFELRRDVFLALREYSPGNYIYANGHRFYPRYFHLQAGDNSQQSEPVLFQVDTATQSVVEHGSPTNESASLGGAYLPAIPMCDVDLPHQSHIGDDEDYRFQLPVAIFGYEQGRHGGGKMYQWGDRTLSVRRAVQLRLVNVGASRLVRGVNEFGYPLCLICGQSRSPFASQVELKHFEDSHFERCAVKPGRVGFYADDTADALTLVECMDRSEAYSVAEALRMGASDVLDMERDDLHVLVVGKPGKPSVDVLLFDPMAGGSGLLDQLLQRWDEVIAAALQVVDGCPAKCDASCIDCLQSYWNAYAHPYLNRKVAAERLKAWGDQVTLSHDIPAIMPVASQSGDSPVNNAEALLAEMLQKAGFPATTPQHQIDLGLPLGSTIVDFFFELPEDSPLDGLCIYLDGLSRKIHGNQQQQGKDKKIRDELKNSKNLEVIAIAASDLSDKNMMAVYFYRIGRLLLGKSKAELLKNDPSWFVTEPTPPKPPDNWAEILELVDEEWRSLLSGLRDAGVPAPDDALWDLPENGRVTGDKAIVVWRPDGEWVVLVNEAEVTREEPSKIFRVGVTSLVAELAAQVKNSLTKNGGAE